MEDLELKLESEVPSVEEVVAALKERGVESFHRDPTGGGDSFVSTEVRVQEEKHKESVVVDEGGKEVEASDSTVDTSVEDTENTKEDGEDQLEDVGENVEEESPQKEPVPRPSSSQYVDFLERERELNMRQNDLDSRKVAAVDRAKELEAELKALRGKPKPKSPIEALKDSGFTLEEANAQILGGWEEPKIDPVDAKISTLQQQLDEAKTLIENMTQKIAERDQADLAAKANAAKDSVITSIKEVSTQEGFEYIQNIGADAYEAVNNLMLEYYNKSKTTLDISDACGIIEKKYEELLGPLWQSEKLRERYGVSKQPIEQPVKVKPETKSRKTLTNKGTASVPAKTQIAGMSDHQAQEEVAKMLVFRD